MVGTRKHPGGDFPQTPTPPASTTARAEPESTKHTARSKSLSRRSDVPKSASSLWTHTPSNLTLLWLAISLPLVIWDTGYVLLRPHSMPGGKLHAPIWKPYALYGTVDYMYGWPAWNNHNGFTAAQGSINLVETIGYGIYLGIVYTYGKDEKVKGRGAPHRLSAFGKVTENLRRLSRARVLSDREAVWATLLGFSISLATVLKTILYGLNESFSGFDNIRHNPPTRLFLLWIIPNGAWIVFPTYMVYVFGQEILEGLGAAAGVSKKAQPRKILF